MLEVVSEALGFVDTMCTLCTVCALSFPLHLALQLFSHAVASSPFAGPYT